MKNFKVKDFALGLALVLSTASCTLTVRAQATPPAPGTPRSVTIPPVQEKKLSNGLTVAVVERKAVPLVTIQLLVRSGAASEGAWELGWLT